MAGYRHHHTPRLLMRGFASEIIAKKKDDLVLTYWYRKDYKCKKVSTKKINFEKYFYGDKGSTVDTKITNYESTYVEFMLSLRALKSSVNINSEECGRFVSHMILRTKHLRDSLQEILNIVATSIDKSTTQGRKTNTLVTCFLKKDQRLLVAQSVKKYIPAHINENDKVLMVKKLLEDYLPKYFENEFSKGIDRFIEELQEKAPDIIKQSHNTVLEDSIFSKPILTAIEDFNWRIIYDSEGTLILTVNVP